MYKFGEKPDPLNIVYGLVVVSNLNLKVLSSYGTLIFLTDSGT